MKLSVLDLGFSLDAIGHYCQQREHLLAQQKALGITDNTEFTIQASSNLTDYRDAEETQILKSLSEIIFLKSACGQIIVPEIFRWQDILGVTPQEIEEWQNIARILFGIHQKKVHTLKESIFLNNKGDLLFGLTNPYAEQLCKASEDVSKADTQTHDFLGKMSSAFNLPPEDLQKLFDRVLEEADVTKTKYSEIPKEQEPCLEIIRNIFLRQIEISKDINGKITTCFEPVTQTRL